MDISQWIERHAAFTPQKAAIRFEGQTISYAELAAQIYCAAQMLAGQLGVRHGDRVSILAYNLPEYLIALFACARLGAILNPLNWRLAEQELLYILQNAEVKAILLQADFSHLVAPLQAALPSSQLVGLDFTPDGGKLWGELMASANGGPHPLNPPLPTLGEGEDLLKPPPLPKLGEGGRGGEGQTIDDPLLLVYTSGTTGLPKGALLTQNALFWNAINAQHMQDLTSADHVLTVLPLFHVGGLNNQTTPALHCGATVTLQARFNPLTTLQAISADKPTATCLVPATMQACIASEAWQHTDFSTLRVLITGSTLVPGHLSERFRAKGVAVLEMYGLTESCPIAIYQRSDSDFSKQSSTGLPALHGAAQIIDPHGNPLPPPQQGEIVLRGPNIMKEYWRNPSATAEALRDGWFHTGDIGYCDEDGYFWVKDRMKNMIISGGENIYAAEVERVLYQHPEVLDCALIGFPDPKWGEKPVAIIVRQQNTSVTDIELKAFMEGKLARYKQPRQYIFVESLPKNAMGKILHYRIREQFR